MQKLHSSKGGASSAKVPQARMHRTEAARERRGIPPPQAMQHLSQYVRWTPHPVIVTTRDNVDYIRALLYSCYTTITGWGVINMLRAHTHTSLIDLGFGSLHLKPCSTKLQFYRGFRLMYQNMPGLRKVGVVMSLPVFFKSGTLCLNLCLEAFKISFLHCKTLCLFMNSILQCKMW